MSRATLKIRLHDETGDEETEHELPAKYEVCSRCEGHGTQLNPSIGGHAYTAEEFDEAFPDAEQREHYFRRGGMYDEPCTECRGQRVVLVVDERACKVGPLREVLRQYRLQERERERSEAEDRATMRMESGGYEC
jgi:DnaJ-class molecular chaperone